MNVQGTAPNPIHFIGAVPIQTAFIAVAGALTTAFLVLTDVSFGTAAAAQLIPTLSPPGKLILLLLFSAAIAGTLSPRLLRKSTQGNRP